MQKWFLGSLKYEKIMENGKEKKVTEKYLIDSLTPTECESRLIEEVTPFISGEFEVKAVATTKYSEVIPSENKADDIWWKCKLSYITLDEKSGAEKKTSVSMLVEACDIRQAIKNLDEYMKGSMADYIIESVSDSKIVDVYPYNAK